MQTKQATSWFLTEKVSKRVRIWLGFDRVAWRLTRRLWRRAARVTHPSIGGRRRVDAQCGVALGAFLAPRFREVLDVKITIQNHEKKRFRSEAPLCIFVRLHFGTQPLQGLAHPIDGFRQLVGRGEYESSWNSMFMDYNWLPTHQKTEQWSTTIASPCVLLPRF